MPIHAALAELERELNTAVEHPLMRELELPYPLLVGRIHAGEWSSSVPDRLEFEGRVGVPVGSSPAEIRARLEATVPDAEISWLGGQFGSGSTPSDHPFVELVSSAMSAELGRKPRRVGVPYGADMRLFTSRGIPCVMAGPPDVRLAHAVDERVAVDDVLLLGARARAGRGGVRGAVAAVPGAGVLRGASSQRRRRWVGGFRGLSAFPRELAWSGC